MELCNATYEDLGLANIGALENCPLCRKPRGLHRPSTNSEAPPNVAQRLPPSQSIATSMFSNSSFLHPRKTIQPNLLHSLGMNFSIGGNIPLRSVQDQNRGSVNCIYCSKICGNPGALSTHLLSCPEKIRRSTASSTTVAQLIIRGAGDIATTILSHVAQQSVNMQQPVNDVVPSTKVDGRSQNSGRNIEHWYINIRNQ
jgi:hypothetical protein